MKQKQPGQAIYDLLKQAKGNHVPLSHLATVVGLPADDLITVCDTLVQYQGVSCRYMRNGDKHEMHYWIEPKGKK